MIAIMHSESGLGPQAYYNDQTGGAFGMMQFRKTSWDYVTMAFNKTDWGRRLIQSPILKEISDTWKLPLSKLALPIGERVVGGVPMYQLVPMISQSFILKKHLDNNWTYTNKTLRVKNPSVASRPLVEYTTDTYKDILQNVHGGEQMIYTLAHICGPSWMTQRDHFEPWMEKRITMDVEKFASMMSDPDIDDHIRQIIADPKIIEMITPIQAVNTGDPLEGPILMNKRGTISYYKVDKKSTRAEINAYTKAHHNRGIGSGWDPFRPSVMTPVGPSPVGHFGIDMQFRYNDLFAPGPGVVIAAEPNKSKGKFIKIRHIGPLQDGWTTEYMHLNKINVRTGDEVKHGQLLGQTGNTGMSAGAHLHFETSNPQGIRRNPIAIDVPFNLEDLSKPASEPLIPADYDNGERGIYYGGH